jgi:hypothetical protein
MSEYNEILDEIEQALQEFPDPGITWRHFFSPGMYCREMTVPPGAVVTSKVHNTEHSFVLSVGELTVKTESGDEVRIKAPYIGTTKQGTRRVAYFHRESVWTTVHYLDWITGKEPEDEIEFYKAIARVEDEIIDKYQNVLLDGEFKNRIQCPSQPLLD